MKQEKLKPYEEVANHGTAMVPLAIHKLDYPAGTEAVFYLHWHREIELLVLTKGTLEMQVDEKYFILEEGDAIFINSGSYHSAKSLNLHGCSFFAIVFSHEFLHSDLHSHFGKKYISSVLDGKVMFTRILKSNIDWQAKILILLHEINTIKENEILEKELMIKARMYAIWELYYTHAQRDEIKLLEPSINQDRIKPVLDYISMHYADDITLTELANLIPMSEGQFCRVFNQITKRRPMQYIMRYRILKSCHLLTESTKKISEIANLSGFNNISYYNKVFLQTIGCTPKEYRNNPSKR